MLVKPIEQKYSSYCKSRLRKKRQALVKVLLNYSEWNALFFNNYYCTGLAYSSFTDVIPVRCQIKKSRVKLCIQLSLFRGSGDPTYCNRKMKFSLNWLFGSTVFFFVFFTIAFIWRIPFFFTNFWYWTTMCKATETNEDLSYLAVCRRNLFALTYWTRTWPYCRVLLPGLIVGSCLQYSFLSFEDSSWYKYRFLQNDRRKAFSN